MSAALLVPVNRRAVRTGFARAPRARIIEVTLVVVIDGSDVRPQQYTLVYFFAHVYFRVFERGQDLFRRVEIISSRTGRNFLLLLPAKATRIAATIAAAKNPITKQTLKAIKRDFQCIAELYSVATSF